MSRKDNFSKYVWLHKILLQLTGVLPLNGSPSITKEAISRLLMVACVAGYNIIMFPNVQALLNRNTSRDKEFEALGIIVLTGGAQLKLVILTIHRKDIQCILSTFENLWPDSASPNYKILMKWAGFANRLTRKICIFTLAVIIQYCFAPMITNVLFINNSTERVLPFAINSDPLETPTYEIVYVIQIVSTYFGGMCWAVIATVAPFLIFNICGQLDLVNFELSEISEATETGGEILNIEHALKTCIRHHRIILGCYEKLENIMCYVNLIQLLTSMYTISISAAQFILSTESDLYRCYCPLFIGILELLFLCWPADILLASSFELANVVYFTPWHFYPKRIQSRLLIMMTRAQQPASLTAGKFVILSLETFCSIMSASFSFFTVLINV